VSAKQFAASQGVCGIRRSLNCICGFVFISGGAQTPEETALRLLRIPQMERDFYLSNSSIFLMPFILEK
jgi:hypothetical protein